MKIVLNHVAFINLDVKSDFSDAGFYASIQCVLTFRFCRFLQSENGTNVVDQPRMML